MGRYFKHGGLFLTVVVVFVLGACGMERSVDRGEGSAETAFWTGKRSFEETQIRGQEDFETIQSVQDSEQPDSGKGMDASLSESADKEKEKVSIQNGDIPENRKSSEKAQQTQDESSDEAILTTREETAGQEASDAEEARRVQEAQAAEEARKAQEAQAAEEARKAQEAQAAEEARKAQEAQAAEEARKAQEAQAAEEARREEEARQAELRAQAEQEAQNVIMQVVNLVNEHRLAAGMDALSADSTLNEAANRRAEEIVRSFSHSRPDGRSCFTVLEEYKIVFRAAGENIAAGQRSAEEVVAAWMNSEGHRENILSGYFGHIGVSCIYVDDMYGYYWVQLFTD